MTNSAFRKLVAKYRGWIENGAAHFPSVYLKEQFVKEMNASKGKV